MSPKPFFLLNPVLETLIFSSNPVLGRKKPFKPYPYKPNCVYLKHSFVLFDVPLCMMLLIILRVTKKPRELKDFVELFNKQ